MYVKQLYSEKAFQKQIFNIFIDIQVNLSKGDTAKELKLSIY